jgi:O-antigen ligase
VYGVYAVLGTPALPFFLLIMGSAFGLAVLYPRAGFVALIMATLFFERFFSLEPLIVGEAVLKLYPIDVLLGGVMIGIVLSLRQKSHRPRLTAAIGWLFAFFIYVTFLFLLSIGGQSDTSLSVAFSTWKQYVFYACLVICVPFLIQGEQDLRLFVKTFLLGIASLGIFLLIGLVRGGGLWTEYTPLSTSGTRFLAFPHAFYFSLALLSLLLSLPYWYKEKSHQTFGIVFLWLLSLGILGSLMRHLWLGIGGILVAALVMRPRVYGKFFSKVSLPFLVPLLVITSLAWYLVSVFPNSDSSYELERATDVVSERVISIGNERDESLAWRGVVWESALKSFAESPFIGIGFGKSVPVELSDYQKYVEVRDMHNSWLALLVQTGIIGLGLLLIYLGTLLVQVMRIHGQSDFLKTLRAVLVGLLFFQGLIFFSQPYLETNLLGIFFWLTVGLLQALLGLSNNPKKD